MKLEEISAYYNVHNVKELQELKENCKQLYDSLEIDCSFESANWKVLIYKNVERINCTNIDISGIKSISMKPKKLENVKIHHSGNGIFINCDRENFKLNLGFVEEKE